MRARSLATSVEFVLRLPLTATARKAAAALTLIALAITAGAPTSAVASAACARAPLTAARRDPPVLGLGSRRPAVRRLQDALARLMYLPGAKRDGIFDMRTWHAVVAFQGWSRLARDGIVGPATRRALARARTPIPWSTSGGFEVHIAQQVLLLVRHARVQRAIHVSTGAAGRTPSGHFAIRAREAMSWSVAFGVWMPLAQHFTGGYAMHGFPHVPACPASHGCVRVPAAEARVVWRLGRVGMRLWTRS